MKLLLDSHVAIWAVEGPINLPAKAKSHLEDASNDLLLSAASIWEIAIKVGLGKLTLSLPYRQWMSKAISDLSATILPITVEYADVLSKLPNHHRDPFDRMLVAQANVESLPVVSGDTVFDRYGVPRLW